MGSGVPIACIQNAYWGQYQPSQGRSLPQGCRWVPPACRLPGAMLRAQGGKKRSRLSWLHSVVVTVHRLTFLCYIIEVFFSPPYFRSWCHLPGFSCITNSELEVRSCLGTWLYASYGEGLGKACFRICEMRS
jgi:hypothetical protein